MMSYSKWGLAFQPQFRRTWTRVWPDLVKISNFGEIFKPMAKMRVYLEFVKFWTYYFENISCFWASFQNCKGPKLNEPSENQVTLKGSDYNYHMISRVVLRFTFWPCTRTIQLLIMKQIGNVLFEKWAIPRFFLYFWLFNTVQFSKCSI